MLVLVAKMIGRLEQPTMKFISAAVSWPGLVRGHEDQSDAALECNNVTNVLSRSWAAMVPV
jgi:hypothetical protein